MRNLFAIIAIIIATTTTVLGQDQKSESKNYIELRGSTTKYGYIDYTRSLPAGWVIEFSHLHIPGQEQSFGGAGRSFKFTDAGTVNTMLYGVAGTNGQLGVMPAVIITIQKNKLKSNAFLGWFIRGKGNVPSYVILDSWDTTIALHKGLDLGVSVGFFRQDGKWNTQAGPIARLNLDKLGSWAISQRFGSGGKELRFTRTFAF